MTVTQRACSAIVGVGATAYTRWGASRPATTMDLAVEAIRAATLDAGLPFSAIDGFAYSAGGLDTGLLAQRMGLGDIWFSASITGKGGGSAGSVGLADAAIRSGQANVVVSVVAFGSETAGAVGGRPEFMPAPTPENDYLTTAGVVTPAHSLALLVARHAHVFGITRDAYAELAVSTRENALTRPTALMRKPLTVETYLAAEPIVSPFCLYDFCLESDGAVAIITAGMDCARDLRCRPVSILSAVHGGSAGWGTGNQWLGMSDDLFTSAGQAGIARRLFGCAALAPSSVDVALIYDHFGPMVLLALEDFGFCERGSSGDFVLNGAIRSPSGTLPVNTHGGHLSEAYVAGMTHIKEAVEQLRGTAVNQIPGAEVALVTGGPSPIPSSALLLGAA